MGKLLDYSADEFAPVTFDTILTPGAGFVLGITPYPFTLGALIQRMIDEEEQEDDIIRRFSFFIAIDLTLIRF